jgi:hypothetical protein
MSTTDSTADYLNIITPTIVLVLSIASFVPGAIGLIFNVLIFTRPALRREPCTLYFFSSTCFNLFVVFIIVPVRTVSTGFNMEMANYNLGICKIEFFAFYVIRVISCWLIAFACVDRYFHSSPNIRIRRLSSLKTARVAIGFTTIIMTILYCHMIVYYEITYTSDQFGNITSACNARQGIYRTFIALWHMTFYSLCPCFLMFLFGFLTINNIRRPSQVRPIIGENSGLGRRTETQLLRMLTAQSLLTIISTLPFSIYRLYASFTANVVKDPLRIAQENLASQTINVISYFAHTSSFYLYTLTGSIFRKELFRIIGRCLPHNQNIVVPVMQSNRQMNVHNASIQ